MLAGVKTIKSANVVLSPKGIRLVSRRVKGPAYDATRSRYSMEKNCGGKWSLITNFDTAAEAIAYAQKEAGL